MKVVSFAVTDPTASPEPPVFRKEAAGGALLKVSDVSKTYKASGRQPITAIERASFEVPSGKVSALLGPSGCGKSTLLRIVAGLDFPTTGHVELDRKPIDGPGQDRGMVFQSYTSFPWLTVRGNVEYGLKLAGVPRSRRRQISDYYLSLVKLDKFADVYPSELSGGMRQRVALARAIAPGPKVLLLDEPFGALDSETRWQMQELLLDVVRRTRLTVLLVTHDVEEALYLADQIVVFHAHPGRVREVMTPNLRQDTPIPKEDFVTMPAFTTWQKRLMGMLRPEDPAD